MGANLSQASRIDRSDEARRHSDFGERSAGNRGRCPNQRGVSQTVRRVSGVPPRSANPARVVGITDGDTLTVLVDQRQIKVRLVEIDAPEKSQAFGKRSKQSLSGLCFNKTAMLTNKGLDRYGRTLAHVECSGVDVNEEQLRRGMAWVYDKHVTERGLYVIQDEAKAKKLGLWADRNPTPPWEWRRTRERATPGTDASNSTAGGSCKIKGNISSHGERAYHVPGQKYYTATQINVSNGERWFCSAAEGRAAGWRAARI